MISSTPSPGTPGEGRGEGSYGRLINNLFATNMPRSAVLLRADPCKRLASRVACECSVSSLRNLAHQHH